MVGKSGEHTFFQGMFGRRIIGKIQSLVVGDIAELVGQLGRLTGGLPVDPKLTATRRIEVRFAGHGKRAQLDEHVGFRAIAKDVVTAFVHIARGALHQKPASLGQRREHAGRFDTSQSLRLEQKPRVTRMHRESQHLPSETCDVAVMIQRPEILEQFLGPLQGPGLRRFEPAKPLQIRDTGGFERKHHLGQIETFHLGQLGLRPLLVFLLHP